MAVRATFTIGPNAKLTLADEQLPPVLAPEHFGEPGKSSLRYDSELLARKPSTDVLVLGSAHAPQGKPAATVPVVLRLGTLEKTLLVHGERVYYDGVAGLAATAPRPFTTRAIQYELAFGGSDTSDPDPPRHRLDERNPVGRDVARSSASLVNTPAHAIEYPTGDPTKVGPAGFGPIEPGWLPRRLLAGTYDAQWIKTKKPLLPDDYEPRFALCAPADQRREGRLRAEYGSARWDLRAPSADSGNRQKLRRPRVTCRTKCYRGAFWMPCPWWSEPSPDDCLPPLCWAARPRPWAEGCCRGLRRRDFRSCSERWVDVPMLGLYPHCAGDCCHDLLQTACPWCSGRSPGVHWRPGHRHVKGCYRDLLLLHVSVAAIGQKGGCSLSSPRRGPNLESYILIRDSVPTGFAVLAAAHASLAIYLRFRDDDEVRQWLAGPFRKAVCKVSDAEFERAKQVPDRLISDCHSEALASRPARLVAGAESKPHAKRPLRPSSRWGSRPAGPLPGPGHGLGVCHPCRVSPSPRNCCPPICAAAPWCRVVRSP